MDFHMAFFVVDTSVIGNTFPSLSAFLTKLFCYCASPVVIQMAMTVSLLGTDHT